MKAIIPRIETEAIDKPFSVIQFVRFCLGFNFLILLRQNIDKDVHFSIWYR